MRPDLPTGTVTFLFTDVEGSTKLLEEIGDDSDDEVLAEHRRIVARGLRRAARSARGRSAMTHALASGPDPRRSTGYERSGQALGPGRRRRLGRGMV